MGITTLSICLYKRFSIFTNDVTARAIKHVPEAASLFRSPASTLMASLKITSNLAVKAAPMMEKV
jgi:hypothetical protein